MNLIENVRGKVAGAKMKVVGVSTAVGTSVLMASNCFAAEDISSAMTTAMGTIKTDMLDVVAVVAPIGIAIAGIFIVWKRGIGFFKSISK